MISFKNRTLIIQVNFLHPNYISMNAAEKDTLIVFFKDTWLFIDSKERQRLKEYTTLKIEIDS